MYMAYVWSFNPRIEAFFVCPFGSENYCLAKNVDV